MNKPFIYRLATGALLASTAATGAPQSSTRLADLLPASITQCAFPPAASIEPERRSVYVETPDRVRLAVDIFLPRDLPRDVRVPALFTATRYWRGEKDAPLEAGYRRWIAAGYAVVNADVRGTGASFGQWYVPYSPQESKDLGFLAQWIGRQSWSNGKVVMTGNSYPGTTPLLALAHAGPAIKAIAPKFSDADLYSDLLWPGGLVAEDLIVSWGKVVRELDLNRGVGFGRAAQASVRPVDGPEGAALLTAAIKDHEINPRGFDVAAYTVTFRDEPLQQSGGLSIDDGVVFRHREAIERSAVPIFGWGSWLDSGIAQGLLNRFLNLSNPQLTIIGPWTHGAKENANVFALDAPLDPSRTAQEQWVHCYLNRYVMDTPTPARERQLIYFTMGENRWKSTDSWPVPGSRQQRYFLDGGHMLSERAPREHAEDSYVVDFEASAGPANRWATQAGGLRIDYGDRSTADRRLLLYTSAPLAQPVEITGQPIVTLQVASNRTDGNVIVYLEDVAPDGIVTYLTEGGLRALHRRLSTETPPYRTTYPYRTFARRDASPLVPGERAALTFQLQATSVRLAAGHRIRLAIAGADKGTFLPIPATGQAGTTLQVYRGGAQPSFIDLPVVAKSQ